MARIGRFLAASALLGWMAGAAAQAQPDFILVNQWVPMQFFSCSGDGSPYCGRLPSLTLAGTGNASPSSILPWRWTRGTNVQVLTEVTGIPHRLSFDGSYVAVEGSHLLLVHEEEQIAIYPPVPVASTRASWISDDGAAVLGYTRTASNLYRPFRWTVAEGFEAIAPPQGFAEAWFRGGTRDGARIAGAAWNDGQHERAFIWTEQSGYEFLPSPAGYQFVTAAGTSADGRVQAGTAVDPGNMNPRVVLWVDRVPRCIGHGYASGMSEDGALVVVSHNQTPFIWSEASGMRPVQDVLVQSGLNLEGATLTLSISIARDGRRIAGSCGVGGYSAAWTATLPQGFGCYANCDTSMSGPVLSVADFTCFLQRFAAGDAYANCDQSTGAPALNVADFTCFLQRFAAGCE